MGTNSTRNDMDGLPGNEKKGQELCVGISQNATFAIANMPIRSQVKSVHAVVHPNESGCHAETLAKHRKSNKKRQRRIEVINCR